MARTTSPSDEFQGAWDGFLDALAAVTRVRAQDEREFVNLVLGQILPAAGDPALRDSLRETLRDMETTPAERTLIEVLTRELWFYVWAYRDAGAELPARVPLHYQFPMREVRRDPLGDDAVDDAETVIGSIEKFIDKLPGPLKKFLHALLEVLKLTHGVT